MIERWRNIDRRLGTILLIVFVQMVGASMALPVLPLYAQRQFSLEPQVITLLVTSFFLAQFLAGPFIGRWSDRSGRIPVLIISQIGTTIAFMMIGFAESFEILFIARILDGITGGNIIVAQAYITDVTPPQKRTQSLGYIFAALGLGFVFGPAIGGGLSAVLGVRAPFLLAAVASAITVTLTWLMLDETVSPEQQQINRKVSPASLGFSQVLANVPLLLILIIAFVGQFAFGILISTFALFGEAVLFAGYDENAVNLGIGILLSVVGIGQFVTQTYLLPRLIQRTDDGMLVFAGAIVRAISMFIYAMVISPWLAGVGSILFAIGTGIMMPALQSMVTRTVEDELRGGVLGLFNSILSLSVIISTALAGILFEIDPTVPYWVSAVMFGLAALPAFFLLRWGRTHKIKNEPIPA